MSRAQDKDTGAQAGAQTGAQAAPQAAGTSSTGTTAGAAATGRTAATGNTTGLRERSGTLPENPSTTARYDQGAAPTPGHRTSGQAGAPSAAGMMGGVLAVVAGLLTFLAGLAAVVRQHFYPALPGYAYRLNVHAWGWILLVLGVLLFAAGVSALLGMAVGRAVGIGLAVLTAVAGFMFLAYTPVWGVIIVALSVVAIWGLLHGAERSESV